MPPSFRTYDTKNLHWHQLSDESLAAPLILRWIGYRAIEFVRITSCAENTNPADEFCNFGIPRPETAQNHHDLPVRFTF